MAIRQRGSSWQVDVKVQGQDNPTGQLVRERQTFKTEREAVRMELLIRAEIVRTGRWNGEADTPAPTRRGDAKETPGKSRAGTLKAALAEAWDHPTKGWAKSKSGDGQYRNAKGVIAILGEDTLCAEIKEEDFYRAAKVLEAAGNSSDTVVRKLQALYRVLWFAQKKHWIKARPEWERPTPGQARQFTFTEDLEAKVIAYFIGVHGNEEMADLFALGIDTGARLGELMAVEANDVLLADRFLLVRGIEDAKGTRSTKNGDVRTVVLADRALIVLKRRIKAVGGRGLLFPKWTSGRVSRLMQMAREEFGYKGNREFTFHATRHTCASRMAERGVEMPHMMEQLGHKTPSITLRYIKMAPSARRAAILRSLGQHAKPVAEAG